MDNNAWLFEKFGYQLKSDYIEFIQCQFSKINMHDSISELKA